MHVDLSITHAVEMVWLAAGLTLLVLVVGARLIARSVVTTGRFANLVEAMVDFVRTNIVEEFLGEHAKKWFGFFAAIFFFILFANLLGKLPDPHVRIADKQHQRHGSPGGDGLRGGAGGRAGEAWATRLISRRSSCCPARRGGCSRWRSLIMPLVLLAEPFSLAVRLFANMFAGHMVLVTFATAQMVGGVWLLHHPNVFAKAAATLPFALSVVLLMFELFIAFIQAFIFALFRRCI